MPRNDRQTQRNFIGGEQSPYLQARVDLDRWHASLSVCENFVPILQGCLTRRSGFADVYPALDISRLIPFAYSRNDGYAIEMAPGRCRFFRDFGILLKDGAPYEIVNSFTADEIAVLDRTQQNDVLFLSCGTKPIQKMARLAQTDWTIGAAVFVNGPFMDQNLDEAVILSTPSTDELVKGTSFTLASNVSLFHPEHVGSLWLLRERDGSATTKWEADGGGIGVGDLRRWDGNTYKCIAGDGDHSGDNSPVHLIGEEWDGNAGRSRKWRYLHSGWGIVKVTSYTNAQSVTVQAQSYIPAQMHDGGTWRWAEGAWSDFRGYPRLVNIHKGRLYARSTRSQPTMTWASCIDDYTNMNAQVRDDTHAFSFDAAGGNTGEMSYPEWMVSGRQLACGTSGGEFVIGSSDVTSPIAADSVDINAATNEGSAPVPAEKVDNPVFISLDRKRVHELAYDLATNDYIAPDLTIEADHIAGAGSVGFVALAWQRDPYRLLWACRSDGVLAAMTYRRDQNIKAWHRHPTIKGNVRSICSTPSPTGIRRDLWAIVERTLVAGTVRRVECLKPFFERGSLAAEDGFFVDGGFETVFEDAVTAVHGIAACYIGETFAVLADGQVRPKVVVEAYDDGSGSITLDRPAKHIVCGLPLRAQVTTLPYDRADIGGKIAGRMLRISHIVVDMIRAAGLFVQAGSRAPELVRPSGDADVSSPAPLYTGTSANIGIDSGWEDGGTVTVWTEDPLPATIRAISPTVQVT